MNEKKVSKTSTVDIVLGKTPQELEVLNTSGFKITVYASADTTPIGKEEQDSRLSYVNNGKKIIIDSIMSNEKMLSFSFEDRDKIRETLTNIKIEFDNLPDNVGAKIGEQQIEQIGRDDAIVSQKLFTDKIVVTTDRREFDNDVEEAIYWTLMGAHEFMHIFQMMITGGYKNSELSKQFPQVLAFAESSEFLTEWDKFFGKKYVDSPREKIQENVATLAELRTALLIAGYDIDDPNSVQPSYKVIYMLLDTMNSYDIGDYFNVPALRLKTQPKEEFWKTKPWEREDVKKALDNVMMALKMFTMIEQSIDIG